MPFVIWGLGILLFLFASFFIASRVCRMLKRKPTWVRITVWGVVILLDFSFFLTRLLHSGCVAFSRALYIVSTTWMPIVLYASMAMAILCLARLVIRKATGNDPYHTPLIVWISAAFTLCTVVAGYITATNTVDNRYEIYTEKFVKGESRRLVLVSDIHTGYAVTGKDVDRLVSDINRMSPDAVIIAGDLIDGDLLPVLKENTCGKLSEIKADGNVVATMGNHEYLDDDKEAEKYLRSIDGLTLLRDQTTDVCGMHIIGRDDVTHNNFYDKPRLKITDFNRADSLFTIVVDHQPRVISDAEEIDADLYVGGHTHAGQIWPMNIITGILFSLDYGYGCYGNTNALVTSGFGTWGPRMRIGTQSEIVIIDIKGTGAPAGTQEAPQENIEVEA